MNRYSVQLDIYPEQHRGRPCFQVGRRGALLVRRAHPAEPWRLVERLEGELSHTELVRSYGCWVDREIASGFWFWKTVTRPLDGEIQSDEVQSFALRVAYSWEAHEGKDTPELPSIEQLTLCVAEGGRGAVATLREVWRH